MSSTEVEYMVLSLEHLDEVSDLLVNHFYTRDIITSGLRFSPENRLTLDLPHIRKCLASGLSVGAREKSTQRLVGVILNLIFTADSPPKPTLKNNNTEAEIDDLKTTVPSTANHGLKISPSNDETNFHRDQIFAKQ
ncbi:uncharacterized protein [Procambarus clarkii]|uniref:uncharacterized protein n=1 Tax=Procambarus clarkii TaxID=6728 RepID=UPI0037424CE7